MGACFSGDRSGRAASRRAGILLHLFALAMLLGACRANAPQQAIPAAPTAAVKLLVAHDGIYAVSVAALRQAGLDLTAPQLETLSLTRSGRPVAFQVIDQGKNQEVRFYGEAPGSGVYAGQSVYWLTPARAEGNGPRRIATRGAAPSDLVAATVVKATVRVEEQKQYDGMMAADEDRWLWQTIFAPTAIETPIQAPHAAEGEAQLRVRLLAYSSAPVTPDHHLVLSLNGSQVADEKWDGVGPHTITATVPGGIVRPGKNTLEIRAPGDTGAPADSVALDWAELAYPRVLAVDQGMLAFGGQAEAYNLTTSDELAALWDITDPVAPVALSDFISQGNQVRFASDDTPRRFITATAAGLRKPAAIIPEAEGDPTDWPGGADLIIVTVPQFRAALQPLVAARQKQGLRVAVVDVQQVYDAFSDGEPGPTAIRRFVQHARAHWTSPAPRYLLLAGDASYDPRGYLQGPESDFVPTHLVRTGFSGWTASDVWYALPDDDSTTLPALAVGRLPAQTAEQLATMVAKTLDYERGDQTATWRQDALVVADNDEPGFTQAAQAFTDQLTSYHTRVATVEGDGSVVRQAVSQAFEQGTGLLGYFGHGSVELWAKEKILAVDDVAKLSNREKLPIVFNVTCLSGLFQHPIKVSLGEMLVRAENGGAVAALVPSSAAVLSDQRVLAQGIAVALGAAAAADGPKTLGDGVLAAQQSITDTSAGVREVLLTFNLLGDPTLPLAR